MSFEVTGYERRYRQAVEDLLFHGYRIHTHLDWHETGDWLDTRPPVRLAWQGQRLLGVLAASKMLHGSTWIRIAAVEDDAPASEVLRALSSALAIELCESGASQISLLITRDWIEEHARALGFQYDEDVVTLQRSGGNLPALRPTPVKLRTMTQDDIARVAVVDHAAFTPPWQMGADELRQAYQISAAATVALQDDTMIGYQISTAYRDGAHLARLAVAPSTQGRGIGSMLLHDVIRRFFRQGVYSMTVNTQASNHRSQRLYRAYGFRRNGYDLGVWSAKPEALASLKPQFMPEQT